MLLAPVIQDDEVESMAGDLVEKRIDCPHPRIGTVHRPEPVALIAHREEAGAILIDELRGVRGVDTQSAVNCAIRVGDARKSYLLLVEDGIGTAGYKRPLAHFSRCDAYRPRPSPVVKARHGQSHSVRPSHLCGEWECKRIIRNDS